MSDHENSPTAAQPAFDPSPGPRKRGSLKIADVEYRVEFRDAASGWDVLRNGVATSILARKKKASAIDSAIRDAKAELAVSRSRIVVTCREGRMLQTLWKAF